ncbi:MAG: D-2-hydroxyacid dehydrogenase [Treponema sp.]|jgi:phosphoglycerate dehydrogenase-like enzyme|nr:D-2-hydroxyacid dehydrogenase [Treponema sp.]
MAKAIVLFETDSAFRDQLRETLQGIQVIFNEGNDTRHIDEGVAQETVIIFGNPSVDFLRRCLHLKWLQLQSAGTDGYVTGELGSTVLLTNASGGYGHGVSEHMVGLTFALMKKLHLYRDEQRECRWQPRGQVKSIQGAVVLVVGLGDIGSDYARRMKALGAYIIGVRRTAHAKPDYVDELLVSGQMEEALPRADIVALIVPGVKNTMGLIGRQQLAKMKKGAIIINDGRGSAIDTEALCDALESGALDGAGLDVTDPEPLPPGHRLWKLENAVITPHVAGGRYLPETGHYIMKLNLENAARFMKGQSLESLVDFKTGYRISQN